MDEQEVTRIYNYLMCKYREEMTSLSRAIHLLSVIRGKNPPDFPSIVLALVQHYEHCEDFVPEWSIRKGK